MLVNELQLYECTVRGTTIQWKHIEYIVSYKRAETSDRDVGARAHCPLGSGGTLYGIRELNPFPTLHAYAYAYASSDACRICDGSVCSNRPLGRDRSRAAPHPPRTRWGGLHAQISTGRRLISHTTTPP